MPKNRLFSEHRSQTWGGAKTQWQVPKEQTGLFILHDNETALADVVAVHGLCGNPYSTWTDEASNNLWLRDFLPLQVPDARIMSFGYDSLVAFSKSEIELGDIAADLLNRLDIERDTPESRNRPVIFICHSLGGIVVKKALILAHERSTAYGGLLAMAKGVIFMGTPHRGADAASWANFVARALGAAQMGTATNTNLLSALKKNSEVLREITKQFTERAPTLRIKTFYEVDKLDYMSSLVVEKDSAILNLPSEIATPISADHRSMCRFAFAEEQKYRPVWRAIKSLVADISQSPSASVAHEHARAQKRPLLLHEAPPYSFARAGSDPTRYSSILEY